MRAGAPSGSAISLTARSLRPRRARAPAPTSWSGGDEERVSMSPRSVPGNRGVAALSATGSTRRRQWLRGRSTWNVGHRWGSAQCSAAGNRDQRQFDLPTEDSHRDVGSTWNNPGHLRVARGSRPACGLLPVHGGALRVAGSDHTVQFHRPATEVDSGTARRPGPVVRSCLGGSDTAHPQSQVGCVAECHEHRRASQRRWRGRISANGHGREAPGAGAPRCRDRRVLHG